MSLVDLGKRLLEAAKVGSVDEVRTLMSNGAPFTTDWLGTSPLHFAALNGHVDTADVLLRAGISRDARTKVDRTSLHVASQEGHTSIVELLIRQGADVEAKDMLRMTPLHWAVERGHIEVIETLLANGADIECHNKFEKTCIDIANGNGRQDITQMLLLSRGHQVSIPRSNHVDLDHIGTAVELEEVTEVNEVQPEITIEQEVISAEAAEGDTYVIDTNSTEGDATQGGYYLTDGSGVTVTEESQEESVVEESAGGEDNTDVLATLAAIAEAKAPISLNTTETLKWLETQGITMLDSDNSTLVGNTVDNGQQVILTEAGKLALKQMIQGKKEVGDQSQKLVTYVDGQMVEVSNQDGNEGSMTVTLQSRDYASGEPALKRIKREEEDSNNLIIEQNVEEETYEENYEEQELSEVDEQQLILKPEPE